MKNTKNADVPLKRHPDWLVAFLGGLALVVATAGSVPPAMGAPALPAPGPASAARQQPGASPLSTTGSGKRDGVDWQSCGADAPGYDCATVTVPLDYDRPARGSTRIALARFPAADTEHRIGSVFVNFGGPGASGVEEVLAGYGQVLGGQLDGRFDVVGFDPRGVGASDPLHCFDSAEALEQFQAAQPAFPYHRDQYRPFFEAWAGLGPECLDDHQRIAGHMNTADVARDLDRLRQAVGDRKLTYLGFSYGSYLGTTYANLFPDKVRALAIDGVLDPRLWSSGWQIRSDRIATQQEFDEFLRLCNAARAQCPFWTREGSQQRWNRLAATLHHQALPLPDGTVYTYDVLIADAVNAMYAPEVWDGAAALFDLVADAALLGEKSAAAQVPRMRAALIEQLTAGTEEADYPNEFDAYYGNQCADTEYPHAFGTWVKIDRYARAGSRFGPYWWWQNTGCAHWPVNQDRYTGPWTADTSSPVLVVGNHFDGVTDYAGAVATDRLLGNSRLLSYAGWGHTAYDRSQCVTEHVNAYLLTVSLPPRATVCPANPNPFLAATPRASRWSPSLGLPAPWQTRPELPTNLAQTDTP